MLSSAIEEPHKQYIIPGYIYPSFLLILGPNWQEWKKGTRISKELGSLIKEMWSKPHKSSAHPDAILSRMNRLDKRWGRRSQEDANEFLMAVLGALQVDTPRLSWTI